MNTRYTRRFSLPERLYAAGSPVVMVAGALLEDAQVPRLVAQLKFKNISPKVITALQVEITCFDTTGTSTVLKEFVYNNLRVRRGQFFGQYTAIALPPDGGVSFAAAVKSVFFADGSSWSVEEGAIWSILPAFTSIEEALGQRDLLHMCHSKLPWAQYAYATAADLWYCPCGRVNHTGEDSCHRCRHIRSRSARYADFASLTTLRQAGLEQAAKAKAEAMTQSVVELASATTVRVKHISINKKRQLQIGVALATIIAAVILLPKIGAIFPTSPITGEQVSGISPAASAQPAEVNVTTPSDGEIVTLNLQEDQNGNVIITREMMLEYFPQMQYFSFNGVPKMGNDIDVYLANTYHMARLIGSGGMAGSSDEYGSFSGRSDRISTRSLLIFSDLTTLCGYAIAAPEKLGEGAWRLQIISCNYDFSALYQKLDRAFIQAETPKFIPAEQMESCGAKWFLNAFNLGRDNEESKNTQLYYLWNQFNSEYLEKHFHDMSELDDGQFTGSMGIDDIERVRYYYLIDKNYQLIGYSKLYSTSNAAHILQPTLSAPTNLRWEYDEYSPNEIALLWDWTPSDGERVEDYRYRIEYTSDGYRWTTGAWNYSQASARPVQVVLFSDQEFKNGEYKFRVTAWKGTDNSHIEAISPSVETDKPLMVTVFEAPFVPSKIEMITETNDQYTLIMESDNLSAGNIYLFHIRARGGNMTTAGSRQANATMAAEGKIEFTLGYSEFPFAKGYSIQFWEVQGQTIINDMPRVTVSAVSKPVVRISEKNHIAAALAVPANFKFQYENRIRTLWDEVVGVEGYELRVEKNGVLYDTYRYEDSSKALNIISRLFHNMARESSPGNRAAILTLQVRALAADPQYNSAWSDALTINITDIISPLKLHSVTKKTDADGSYFAFALEDGEDFAGGYWYLASFPLNEPNSVYTISVKVPSQRDIFTAKSTTGTLDEKKMNGTALLLRIGATYQSETEMTVVITGTQDEPVKIQ